MKVAKLLFLVTVVLLVYFSTIPGWYVVGEEEGSSIPVHFLENKEICLNLYPAGFQAAAVFTGEGIDGNTPVEPLKRLAALLGNKGIMGTFFIYPGSTFKKNIASAHPRIKSVKKLFIYGFEIAQAGQSIPPVPELGDDLIAKSPELLSLPKRAGQIKSGRKILAMLGRDPDGYRNYDSSGTDQVLSILDKLGYLYCCRSDEFPASRRSSEMSYNRVRQDSYLYPRVSEGLQILEFYSRIDPTKDPEKARELFQKISRDSGVFIYSTRLPEGADAANLEKLRQFIEYLKKQNTWLCSLRELSGWWKARRQVKIETRRDDNTLVLTYYNPTRFSLKNARVIFKDGDIPYSYYRVEDRRGVMASEGSIPSSHFINVTIFPDEPVNNR